MKSTFEDQTRAVVRMLTELQGRKYYGEVTLVLQGGNVVLLRKVQTEKLEDPDGHAGTEARKGGG